MTRLRKLADLSSVERLWLIKVALLLGMIRLGLRLLGFRTLWRLLSHARPTSVGGGAGRSDSAERIAWAVSVAGPYVLDDKPCLAQALAAHLLLVRRGFPAQLRVGVARGERGQVEAHAWVESDHRVVVGGSVTELARYTPLLALDAVAQ
jgi:Transglutaminase-like superfamily